MINGQPDAVHIEHILCRIFDCERYGFGGVVNSDFIRANPFTAIFSGLAHIHATADETKKAAIEKYIETYMYYSDMGIDELLSFDTAEKVVNGTTVGIGFENGRQAMDAIVADFEKLTN